MSGEGSETPGPKYGDVMADVYDTYYDGWFSAEDVQRRVRFLAALAGGGGALELGVGTGRLAIPLAAAGTRVTGVDNSQAMLDKLAAKPGAEGVERVCADFASLSLGTRFALVYLVANGLLYCTDQAAQARVLGTAAEHLADGGHLVLETLVPDPSRWQNGGMALRVERIEPDALYLLASLHDPVRQLINSHQVVVRDGGVHTFPEQLRYVYPAELDLMARLAGLTLVDRVGSWAGEPFTADSRDALSVYRRD